MSPSDGTGRAAGRPYPGRPAARAACRAICELEARSYALMGGHLAARANRLSHRLRAKGVQVGDAVAMLLHNEPVALAFDRWAARRDGYFTAGEPGPLDADVYLFISGRRINLILPGGVSIDPAGIEVALMQQPAVADAVVFGLPDEEWGQRVQAVVPPVVRAAGQAVPDPAAMRAALLARCIG